MLTEEILKNSKEFKEWVDGRIALIHNTYYDSEDKSYASFIVIHSPKESMGKWTITRFFEMGGKIQVSVDAQNISTIEVFVKLLSDYSRGLA